ncbi:MAG: nitroreductase/quinone reductase family protein [Pseudomonadota bacterium]
MADFNLPTLLAPINARLAPLLRRGLANPLAFTPGLTVLEVPGRKSGKPRSVPLVSYLAGPVLIIGTVRAKSQWIRNLEAAENPRVWLWGRRWPVAKLLVTDNVAVLSLRCTARV